MLDAYEQHQITPDIYVERRIQGDVYTARLIIRRNGKEIASEYMSPDAFQAVIDLQQRVLNSLTGAHVVFGNGTHANKI